MHGRVVARLCRAACVLRVAALFAPPCWRHLRSHVLLAMMESEDARRTNTQPEPSCVYCNGCAELWTDVRAANALARLSDASLGRSVRHRATLAWTQPCWLLDADPRRAGGPVPTYRFW